MLGKIGLRGTLRKLSSYYRKTAYLFTLMMVVVSLGTLPLSASGQQQSSQLLTLTFSNVKCTTGTEVFGRGGAIGAAVLTGTATVSGTGYAGTLYFNGTTAISIVSNSTMYSLSGNSQNGNALTETTSFNNRTLGGIQPPSINYPGQNSINFRTSVFYQEGNPGQDTCGADSLTLYAYPPGGHMYVATESTTLANQGNIENDIYYKVVALPLFNDSMLGVSGVNSTDPQLPLSGIYNFMMGISLIIIVGGGLLSAFLFSKFDNEPMERKPLRVITSIVLAIAAVLIFPAVYNEIARVVNYLDMGIISYPKPYQDYATTLQTLWNNLQNQQGGITIWNFFSQAFLQIADWVIALIVWLLLYFLGTIRIFMLGAVIVGFPISMGLRLIPFAKKLSDMIDDTLFGLILASIMSSIVLGVGSYMLGNWSTPGNIFAFAGIGQNWVADSAIIAALLMPTVFAPLTATVFQTSSQIAMAGGSVAAMMVGGAAMAAGPVVPGALSSGMGAARGALASGGSGVGGGIMSQSMGAFGNLYSGTPLSIGQKIAQQMALTGGAIGSGMKAFGSHMLKHATPGVVQNVGTLGTAGVLGAVGAGAAGSTIRKSFPLVKPSDALARSEAGLGIAKINALIRDSASQLTTSTGGMPSGSATDSDAWVNKIARMQPKQVVVTLEKAGVLEHGSSEKQYMAKAGSHFAKQIRLFIDPSTQKVLPQHENTVNGLSKRIILEE